MDAGNGHLAAINKLHKSKNGSDNCVIVRTPVTHASNGCAHQIPVTMPSARTSEAGVVKKETCFFLHFMLFLAFLEQKIRVIQKNHLMFSSCFLC